MSNMFKPVETTLPAKVGFWSKFKAFWLQDVEELLGRDVEDLLTKEEGEVAPAPAQEEGALDAFLFQEITWQKIHDFLFQEITFGKKKA